MYFSEHKFVAEIDKKSHIDRIQKEENERQTKQKNILIACSFTGLILM